MSEKQQFILLDDDDTTWASSSNDQHKEERTTNHSSMKKPQQTVTKRCRGVRSIWSEDDVIRVLQCAIDHRNNTGLSHHDDMSKFYPWVKRFIGFDVARVQLREKLRSLKIRFEKNLEEVEEEEEAVFFNAHDRKVFELSKVIWGAKEEKKKKKRVDECFIVELLAPYGVDDVAAKHGWSKLCLEDKKRFEAKWKTLQFGDQFESCSQKIGFIREVITTMVEAFSINSLDFRVK